MADPIVANDILSALTDREATKLAEVASDAAVIEIGSYLGKSTIALGSTGRVVHAIDPHIDHTLEGENTLPGFLFNLERYGVAQRVVTHIAHWEHVIPLFRDDVFDVGFYDAAHQRAPTASGVGALLRVVRPGGLVAVHDYGRPGVEINGVWHPFAVEQAVDPIAEMIGGTIEVVETLALLRLP